MVVAGLSELLSVPYFSFPAPLSAQQVWVCICVFAFDGGLAVMQRVDSRAFLQFNTGV